MTKRILHLFIYIVAVSIFTACSSVWDNQYEDTSFVAFQSASQSSVSAVSVADLTKHTAVLGFSFSSSDADITEYGICYSSSNTTPTINNATIMSEQGGGRGGNPSFSVSGLVSKTTYYVRAYVVSMMGTQYGETIQFTTPTSAPNEGDNGTPKD